MCLFSFSFILVKETYKNTSKLNSGFWFPETAAWISQINSPAKNNRKYYIAQFYIFFKNYFKCIKNLKTVGTNYFMKEL